MSDLPLTIGLTRSPYTEALFDGTVRPAGIDLTLRTEFGDEAFRRYYQPASELIADICLSEDYTDFLTTPAYELVG